MLYMSFFLSYMATYPLHGRYYSRSTPYCSHTTSGSAPRQDHPRTPRLSPPRSSTSGSALSLHVRIRPESPRQDHPRHPRLSPPRSSTPKIYPDIHAKTIPDHPRQDHPRTPRQDHRHHHRLLTLSEVQPLRHALPRRHAAHHPFYVIS